MKCPECGTEMELVEEYVNPKVDVYECPNCGHKEAV